MSSPAGDAERDALADALALIDADHRQDLGDMQVLLDNCDPVRTAVWLARIAGDLLEDLSGWLGDDVASMLERQRAGWLPPGPLEESWEEWGTWQD